MDCTGVAVGREVLKGKTGPGWNECGAEVGSLVY